jgi:hypothetical protein
VVQGPEEAIRRSGRVARRSTDDLEQRRVDVVEHDRQMATLWFVQIQSHCSESP